MVLRTVKAMKFIEEYVRFIAANCFTIYIKLAWSENDKHTLVYTKHEILFKSIIVNNWLKLFNFNDFVGYIRAGKLYAGSSWDQWTVRNKDYFPFMEVSISYNTIYIRGNSGCLIERWKRTEER